MSEDRLLAAHRALVAALDEVDAAVAVACDAGLVRHLVDAELARRRVDRSLVGAVAVLERRGVFAERGYGRSAAALCDLLGWDHAEATRVLTAARVTAPRTALDGAVLPPLLPDTAAVFAAGGCTVRHVVEIARRVESPAAARLSPQVLVGVEAELAQRATEFTPQELRRFAIELISVLDEDGADPDDDDRPPVEVNELHLVPHGDRPGGTIRGQLDSPELWDAMVVFSDAQSKPLTADDDRSPATRRAEALSDLFALGLDAGRVPQTGGVRPHLVITMRLADLERRARGAMLDVGGHLSPAALRTLACDAAVIPVVLGGAGQPLDVGRATRTIPDGMRRAVLARDRGCAHPGCDRPPSWCEVHHVHEWQHGGATMIENLVALCRTHHRQVHASGWEIRFRHGIPEFVPPAWVDPRRTPRRRPVPGVAA